MDRLLVIDDEMELARFIGRVGESTGYEVRATCKADDFKDSFVQWHPGVIIVDLAMPEVDGLEILRWLAAQNCRAQIAIMSGFDQRVIEAARRIAEERGLTICFTIGKPMRLHDIKEKLMSLRGAQPAQMEKADLARAFAAGEIFLQYQPKVELKTGALQGVEALVRWRHPRHGLVASDIFVGLAEEAGLIDELTDFVLTQALTQQKAWFDADLDVPMAVNLSPSNLRDEHFTDRLTELCRAKGVAPQSLTLEVTESVAMNRSLEALDILTRLRLKGFHLSIDDFGTGFSSLTRLQRLPVTEIKVDRSFVGEVPKMSDSFVIVKTIIDLAHNMRMRSVAEGIETPTHYQILTELGCEVGQGYAIAKPMAGEDLPAWHAEWRAPAPIAMASI